MSQLTKDPNALMKRWMVVYMNLNVMRSTNPAVMEVLDELKDKLAECNEVAMRFFDLIGARLEEEG